MLVDIICWDTGAAIEVHDARCSDPARKSKYRNSDYRLNGNAPVEVRDRRDAVDFVYGPAAGSFYAEQGVSDEDGWKANIVSFVFFPCVQSLPVDIGR